MKPESELEQERERYSQALARAVVALPRALARLPEQVWLCGSYVHGRRDLLTDLDLLVVMRSEFVTRTAQLYRRLAALTPIAVDVDLFVYTPEELARMRERGFVKRALAEGQLMRSEPREGTR